MEPRRRIWFESRDDWGTFTLIELRKVETADGMLREESEHLATVRHRKGSYQAEIKMPSASVYVDGCESLDAARMAVGNILSTNDVYDAKRG